MSSPFISSNLSDLRLGLGLFSLLPGSAVGISKHHYGGE